MSREDDQHGPCPIQWGDRVDHKLFGFGTIVGEPVPMVGRLRAARCGRSRVAGGSMSNGKILHGQPRISASIPRGRMCCARRRRRVPRGMPIGKTSGGNAWRRWGRQEPEPRPMWITPFATSRRSRQRGSRSSGELKTRLSSKLRHFLLRMPGVSIHSRGQTPRELSEALFVECKATLQASIGAIMSVSKEVRRRTRDKPRSAGPGR